MKSNRMKKLFAALTAAAALSLSISLPASAEGGTGISIDGTSYGSIAEAVAAAAEGATILLEDGSYEAAGIDLTKDVTIQGSGSTNILVPDKGGEDFGFRIADGAAVTFDGLNITADETVTGENSILALIYIANDGSTPAEVAVQNCTLVNVGEMKGYRHAISLEGKSYPGPDTRYFNLTVDGCSITSDSYGIGSGLDNNAPTVSDSTLKVTDTEFNTEGSSSIYNIHLPKALKFVEVENCSFNSVRSGGIKYIYSDSNEVRIIGNDFTGCNQEQISGTYAIMATTQTADYSDPRAYSYATELSGNKLNGQNTIIAVKSQVEAVWFPDGQAVNNTAVNNYGDENATDEGTRYGKSQWGGNKSFIVLTDFSLSSTGISFASKDAAAQIIQYRYNGETSGVYSNYYPLDTYWTEENPRHCGASLADFAEANAITRWYLKGSNAEFTPDSENSSILTAEDEIARVEINTAAGSITVTPKSVGTTYLYGVVGGGAFEMSDNTWTLDENGLRVPSLPNSKTAVCPITVQEPYTPTPDVDYYRVTVNYLEDGTDTVLADAYQSARKTQGSRYDVTAEAAKAIDGYHIVRTAGDAVTGYLTKDRVINVYYSKDADEIPDEETPLTPPTNPETPDEEIPDEETPLVQPPQTGMARTTASSAAAAAVVCAAAFVLRKKSK
ncbi:MAG: LPXTG cell wall anchor domain-containing protein [Candidatus Merdivicinus sp.]|jgi:LPXTG-motif cell wall-anchored protein